MNKKIVFPLLLISILVLGTVTALTISVLTAEKINLFGGSIQDTDFSITGIDTQFKGKNKITINLEITNNDVAGHSANITVQLLDINGDILIEHTVLTGVVTSLGTYSYSNTFTSPNLVSLYESNYIIIKQIN